MYVHFLSTHAAICIVAQVHQTRTKEAPGITAIG